MCIIGNSLPFVLNGRAINIISITDMLPCSNRHNSSKQWEIERYRAFTTRTIKPTEATLKSHWRIEESVMDNNYGDGKKVL